MKGIVWPQKFTSFSWSESLAQAFASFLCAKIWIKFAFVRCSCLSLNHTSLNTHKKWSENYCKQPSTRWTSRRVNCDKWINEKRKMEKIKCWRFCVRSRKRILAIKCCFFRSEALTIHVSLHASNSSHLVVRGQKTRKEIRKSEKMHKLHDIKSFHLLHTFLRWLQNF